MLAPSQFKQLIVSCGMELYYSGDLVVIASQEDRDNDLEYYQSAQNIPWPIVGGGFFTIFVAHTSPPMCSRLGGLALGLPTIFLMRMKPVSGRLCMGSDSRVVECTTYYLHSF